MLAKSQRNQINSDMWWECRLEPTLYFCSSGATEPSKSLGLRRCHLGDSERPMPWLWDLPSVFQQTDEKWNPFCKSPRTRWLRAGGLHRGGIFGLLATPGPKPQRFIFFNLSGQGWLCFSVARMQQFFSLLWVYVHQETGQLRSANQHKAQCHYEQLRSWVTHQRARLQEPQQLPALAVLSKRPV